MFLGVGEICVGFVSKKLMVDCNTVYRVGCCFWNSMFAMTVELMFYCLFLSHRNDESADQSAVLFRLGETALRLMYANHECVGLRAWK